VYLFTLTDVAGTGIELEVLFDAALNDGRLNWRDVLPRIDGQGPLVVLARTDKGYVLMIHWAPCVAVLLPLVSRALASPE
jgi:hypothetical protein